MTDVQTPFRWDLTRRNQLGRLISGERARTYNAFPDQLLQCCARVLAFSGEADLVFVGRSPESIFDHMSGLLLNTSWFERLQLLHFSMRSWDEATIRKEHPEAIQSMRSYLSQLGLHPEGIATKPRPVAFVDLVLTGDTFGRLIMFLRNWAEDTKYDWRAVRRRIQLVGITERTKTSPKTWRWQQHASWLPLLGRRSVKNVSIPRELWGYLGDYQDKVSQSHAPFRWADPAQSFPTHDEQQLKALRLAFELFESGRARERKDQFASLLVKEPAMKDDWFRMLVQEIRS